MIPVSLKLRNFLSYGTTTEPLDFEQFHVACLSGGNGQGKSALLDAITWAVWGEARKASDARKPDEDLLRIGTREMSVELVFDLDGGRYRVVRSFYRTASGKTSKPGLEFQAQDGDAFRPLTAGSVKDTQAVIDATIGLDYETFINSAFLLQGRSDEFTKKKPGERKDILGRILGLDRFERYAAVARSRYSEATERARVAEAEVGRLNAQLEGVGQWEEEQAVLSSALADLDAERAGAEAEGRRLTERLAELDALARTAEQQQARLARLEAGRQGKEKDHAEIGEKIAEAEALVAQREAVEQAHARHEVLLAERKTWDDKDDLQRGLTNQLREKELALERTRMEAEARLSRTEADLQASQKARAEAERRLTERGSAERGLARARAAQQQLGVLRTRRDARTQLEERVTALDKQLANARGQLQARIANGHVAVREAAEQEAQLPALRERATALAAQADGRKALERQRDEVGDAGSRAKAALGALDAERDRLAAAQAALDAKVEKLHAVEAADCPTCGTPLTDEHRRTVEATYAAERAALDAESQRLGRQRAEAEQAVQTLRERYKTVAAQLAQASQVADALADLRARLTAAEAASQTAADKAALLAELEVQLRDDAYRPDLRAERTTLTDRLADLPFDAEQFDRLQAEAAHAARYEATLAELSVVQERLGVLAQQVEAGEREVAGFRARLADGTVLGPLRQQIDRLRQQLDSVGYDPARHDAVKRELATLKDATERYMRLANAERNLTDWTARRAALAAELEQAEAESVTLRAEGAAAAERLAARPGLADAQRTQAERRGALAARISQVQAQLGGLAEKLERAAAQRETLKTLRAGLREAKKEKTLYRHLRDAFGKNGIPALIIEETLPEIENRTNGLLERLAKGRTRVTLETLKDKKAGGTKETLDIKITDAGGVPRPYETFSGGEAFRVNFALRIALAQLLAERSGVRIRTLVVDEGFGTQDKQGIERLVEAIQAIREDFDKILVITHLDELKEAFPVRIEVKKDPVDGSGYDVIGV